MRVNGSRQLRVSQDGDAVTLAGERRRVTATSWASTANCWPCARTDGHQMSAGRRAAPRDVRRLRTGDRHGASPEGRRPAEGAAPDVGGGARGGGSGGATRTHFRPLPGQPAAIVTARRREATRRQGWMDCHGGRRSHSMGASSPTLLRVAVAARVVVHDPSMAWHGMALEASQKLAPSKAKIEDPQRWAWNCSCAHFRDGQHGARGGSRQAESQMQAPGIGRSTPPGHPPGAALRRVARGTGDAARHPGAARRRQKRRQTRTRQARCVPASRREYPWVPPQGALACRLGLLWPGAWRRRHHHFHHQFEITQI
ncbi:hypothetical protein PCL_00558 [Purpureocillium lilacinum]|uniref:Uncharacterized protein n=1 Tax=Purpureocillium lilacinum TaxID=33203 RepID=A0A2U3E583_PURLI|nr:hypothetical protein Purlil1_9465 [Purpureocillium lilacinum]PWI69646.1 hypothetical protein PCL_00558 [Purpureocillium lilacinum]